MNRDHLIASWLRALHARCQPSSSAEQHAEYARTMADIVARLPTEAFCQRSYMWVAAECPKGAPNAAALRQLLGQWCKDNLDAGAVGSEAQAYIDGFARRWTSGAPRPMLLALAAQHYPKEAWDFIRVHYVLPDEPDGDEDDRRWWRDRIERLAKHPNPTYRWREAVAMRDVLTRPEALVRQWAIDRLTEIIGIAAIGGANTDPTRVPYAPSLDREKVA